MKLLVSRIVFYGLILAASITSCNKNRTDRYAPVAVAGDFITAQLLSCNDSTGSAELNGNGSYDPDSNIVSYRWKYNYGPQGFILSNADSPIAKVDKISYGIYTFELTVTDKEGLSGKDIVNVNTTLKEQNLDITYNGAFEFIDNYYDQYYYEYYDLTSINGVVNYSPFGDYSLNISEHADTADLTNAHVTILRLDRGYSHYIMGDCSVNFKKLIKAGGGPFVGTILLTVGSAQVCNVSLTNIFPLSITGNLDLASDRILMRIQGGVYL